MRLVAPRHRRRRREGVVAMINVVFLLLAFFLMTASMGAAPPFPLALPVADAAATAAGQAPVFLARDGRISYAGRTGDAALAALRSAAPAVVEVHADAPLPARDLVRFLLRLGAEGTGEVRLVSRPR